MPGPYYAGQQPSSCGHYYPDVLRLRDEKRPDGTLVRIMDCSYCGRYEFELDAKTLDKALVHTLHRQGFEIGTREDEIAAVRQQELRRFVSKGKNKDRALEMLQVAIDDALQAGADSVELEYVAEGLEVTYMFGNNGISRVIDDRMLGGEMIGLIVERAQLENKSRGVLEWPYHGKPRKITVVEYENFGESAYKLLLRPSRRKRAYR